MVTFSVRWNWFTRMLEAPFLTISIFALISLLIFNWIRNKVSRRPPGPLNLPIIGSLHLLMSKRRQPYEVLTDLVKQYGKIYGMQLGSIYTIVLSDPSLIRDALKREEFTGRAPLYLTHGIMGGYGLICAEGSLWREQRKSSISWLRQLGMVKFQSPSRRQLELRIMDGVNDAIQEITERIPDDNTSTKLDMLPILLNSIGNVMNRLVFGITYKSDDPTWKYLQHLQEEGVKYIGISGGVNFLPFLRFLPSNKRRIKFVLDGKRETHRIYDEIIKSVAEELEEKNYEIGENSSILELFLMERNNRKYDPNDPIFDDVQLRHLLADLFGAGVDTTLSTMRWILLYVSQDRDIKRKIQMEMDKVLEDGSSPSLEHYDLMPYLRACIAEGQRIRSVVPVGIPHGATEEIEIGGFKVPANTMLIPLQWAVHMNPKTWPEPEHFNPNRFYDEKTNEFSAPNHFIPFQTGKRMCLGDELGKMLLFLFISNILFHFDLNLDQIPGMKGNCGITLTPSDHHFIVHRNKENCS